VMSHLQEKTAPLLFCSHHLGTSKKELGSFYHFKREINLYLITQNAVK
jgi:hypothetical protein